MATIQKSKELERLLRGQAKLAQSLEEIKHSIENLPGAIAQLVTGVASREDVVAEYSLEKEAAPSSRALPNPDISTGHSVTFALPADGSEKRASPVPELERLMSPIAETDEDLQPSSNIWAPAAYGSLTLANSTPFPTVPHEVLHEISTGMQRNDYAQVKLLVHSCHLERMNSSKSGRAGFRDQSRIGLWSYLINLFPLRPTSHSRIAFDCFALLVLVYDSVMVPVIIAWDLEYEGVLLVLAWLFIGFWSTDMFLNFVTGYSDSGRMQMEYLAIFKRYMKTGFVVDAAVLSVDCAELLTSALLGGDNGSSLRVLKFVRLMKITRLVRIIAKLRMGLRTQIDAIWYYRIHVHGLQNYAQYMRLGGMLFKLLLLIAWLSHFGSCLWYFLGRMLSNRREATWYNDLPQKPDVEHYVDGLYWTLSTIFSGASFVSPNNTWEAAFASLCVVMGAIFVTAITSSLAAILIEAQEVQQETTKKDRALTQFLEQRNTPVLLALDVRASFKAAMSASANLTELDVPFLGLVRPYLRAALREHQYADHFISLPIFRILAEGSDPVLQELCSSAATFSVCAAGEELLSPGQLAEGCILLAEGHMRYTLSAPSSEMQHLGSDSSAESSLDIVAHGESTAVRPGTWISELSLFMRWKALGFMEVDENASLLTVSVEAFLKLVASSSGMLSIASSFAMAVCNALQPPLDPAVPSPSPTDISSGLDTSILVSGLHWTIRQLMSLPLLRSLKAQQGTFLSFMQRKSFQDLEAEVLSAKCYLLRGDTLSVTRVVRLSVLRLVNSQGLVCMQVGTWSPGANQTKVHYPAIKLEGSESPGEGLDRLLGTEFEAFAPYMRLQSTETLVESSVSASFNLQTMYVRVVHTAALDAAMSFSTRSDVDVMRPLRTPRFMLQTQSTKSYSTAAPAATLRNSPLSTDGPGHAFGIGALQSETRRVVVYKWITPEELEGFSVDKRELVNSLSPWVSQLTFPQVRQLMQWTLSASRSVHDLHLAIQESHEEDQEENRFSV